MKIATGVLMFALCCSLPVAAQVQLPGCGCGVSSSAVSCSCPEAVNIDGSANKQTVCGENREIAADSITLSPGAPLTKWVPGEDDLIVGEGDGTLRNEAKSPTVDIKVTPGIVLFLPKGEPYKLQNISKQNLRIIVIRMRPTSAVSQ